MPAGRCPADVRKQDFGRARNRRTFGDFGMRFDPAASIFVSVDLGALGDVIQDPSNSISVDLGDLKGVVL